MRVFPEKTGVPVSRYECGGSCLEHGWHHPMVQRHGWNEREGRSGIHVAYLSRVGTFFCWPGASVSRCFSTEHEFSLSPGEISDPQFPARSVSLLTQLPCFLLDSWPEVL